MAWPRLVPLIASLFLAGCGGNPAPAAPAPAGTAEAGTPAPAAGDPSRITADEIAATGAATAYDVVDRLHREWLRDKLTGKPVAVYQDNQRLGGEDALRGLQVQDVAELQYLDGRTAVMRWGPEVDGGVIIVVRNRT